MNPQNLAKLSSPSQRRSQITNAFLAHRLSRAQLHEISGKLEQDEAQWQDTFEALTDRANIGSDDVSPKEFETTVSGLGLRERFENLADDEIWSMEDRALYRRFAHDSPTARPKAPVKSEPLAKALFFNTVENNFLQWDRNGDLRLDNTELDILMSGGFYGELSQVANDPLTAAGLSTLRRFSGLFESAYPHDGNGISRQDLNLMKEGKRPAHKQLGDIAGAAFKDYQVKISEADLDRPISQEKIGPLEIHQGTAGSCVFLSAAAGSEQSTLQSMIQNESEGKYSVHFADGDVETVHEPTLAERLYHSKGEGLDRWPAVLEIGLAQRLMESGSRNYNTLRNAIDGIEPALAFKALHNENVDQRSLDELTVHGTRDALADLMTRPGPKICATRPTASSDFISVEDLYNGCRSLQKC